MIIEESLKQPPPAIREVEDVAEAEDAAEAVEEEVVEIEVGDGITLIRLPLLRIRTTISKEKGQRRGPG